MLHAKASNPESAASRIGAMRGRTLLIAAGVLLLIITALLLVPIPATRREGQKLLDLAHAPVFAMIAIIVLGLLRRFTNIRPWLAYLSAWIVAVLFGCTTELIQAYTLRGPSVADAIHNAWGAAAGLAFAAFLEIRSGVRWLICAFGIGAIVYSEFSTCVLLYDSYRMAQSLPVLGSFESDLEFSRWRGNAAKMGRMQAYALDGSNVMVAEFLPAKYSNIMLVDGPQKWEGYRNLVFSARIFEPGDAAPEPLTLTVKVIDEGTNWKTEDRFEKQYVLSPAWQTISIPLAEIESAPLGRKLNLNRIRFLEFYVVGLQRSRFIMFDNIRLE